MKVMVLGAGVIGVTTAYYLNELGHEVRVIDRQPGPALETSFANAGEISPGYASPWASPGLPIKAARWLLMRRGPLVIRPRWSPQMWRWVIRLLRNCNASSYAINKHRMVGLAEYSRDRLRQLRADLDLQYDHATLGTLQLFRTQKQLDQIEEDLRVLDQYGVPYELLNPEGCIRAEPALAHVAERIQGGLHLPDDETGDCYKFTVSLAATAEARGVQFDYGTAILRLHSVGGQIESIATSKGPLCADAYVVALGSYSPQLLRAAGIDIPVYPVKGYCITLRISDSMAAPVSTVMDETYKVAITRLGERMRVGGTAEISGYELQLPERRRETLEYSARSLFPHAAQFEEYEYWTGLRPMTPDGPPIIGATRYRNLFLNTGHGTLGWTMACGSGKAIADLISQRTPEISIGDLAISRYE